MKIDEMTVLELIDVIRKYRIDSDIMSLMSVDGGKTYVHSLNDKNTLSEHDIELYQLANPGIDIILWVGENVEYPGEQNE